MISLSTLEGQRHPTGVKTNGIGRPCTSHLNLTVSLGTEEEVERQGHRLTIVRRQVEKLERPW